MKPQILPLGYGHYMLSSQVVGIHDFNTSPLKRLMNDAEKKLKLVDATSGRKTRSMIVTDSGHFYLCAVDSYTLIQRLAKVLDVKLTAFKSSPDDEDRPAPTPAPGPGTSVPRPLGFP